MDLMQIEFMKFQKVYKLDVFNLVLDPYQDFDMGKIEEIIYKNKISHLALIITKHQLGD